MLQPLRVFSGLIFLTAPVFLAACAVRSGSSSNPEKKPGGLTLELALRIPGEARGGELGFRFSRPCDLDGDSIADIAAGARYTDLEFSQMGTVTVWSSDGGTELAHWEGHAEDGLFGHSVLAGPDLDGDRKGDVIAAAPNGQYHGVYRGLLYARSVATGRRLWSVVGERHEGFGWDMARAGDQNGDGTEDVFVGAPSSDGGRVYLVGGDDGATLRVFSSSGKHDQFGWYVAAPSTPRSAPEQLDPGGSGVSRVGAAYALSACSGETLHLWYGARADGMFGEVVAGLSDLDGDSVGDVVVGAPVAASQAGELETPGEVFVFSGTSGAPIHCFTGRPGELYGRMVSDAGDLDDDGASDIAIGAPWATVSGMVKAGRFEVRSGRTGELLASVSGARADMWLGWHIAGAEDVGREKKRGLLVAALRSEENGLAGAAALYLYVVREP